MNRKEYTQEMKDKIFDTVQDREIFILHMGVKYKSSIYGRRLNFPYIVADFQNHKIFADISWALAEKLAEGTVTTVLL